MKNVDFSGQRVTVMGLGLNGGGVETTRFLAQHGADVTVTDLRDEKTLAPSLEKLSGVPFRAVLGTHEESDFSSADIVIKNPAVRPNNHYISLARCVETDLSLFFSAIDNPVIAVTGSKGKSTTASAIHWGLLETYPNARIGGNITISPLSFIDQMLPGDPVVMELSSFQLGDLVRTTSFVRDQMRGSFPPFIAIITNIFHDHQDYYGAMEPYLRDKEAIFRFQKPDQFAIFCTDDAYGKSFAENAPSHAWRLSTGPKRTDETNAWLAATAPSSDSFVGAAGYLRLSGQGENSEIVQVLDERLSLAGRHHRLNLLFAASALHLMNIETSQIRGRLGAFTGVAHRLETIRQWRGITFINDSAATIPEAALGAVSSLAGPIHLVTGGTDKALEFSLFTEIHQQVTTFHLLKGSASDKIAALLKESNMSYSGPWDNLEECIRAIVKTAESGDTVLLSPGCASFGMFLNEFDRGTKFKELVLNITA